MQCKTDINRFSPPQPLPTPRPKWRQAARTPQPSRHRATIRREDAPRYLAGIRAIEVIDSIGSFNYLDSLDHLERIDGIETIERIDSPLTTAHSSLITDRQDANFVLPSRRLAEIGEALHAQAGVAGRGGRGFADNQMVGKADADDVRSFGDAARDRKVFR